MKKVKKALLFIISLFSAFIFFGCESTNDLRCVFFNEITSPGSLAFTVKISLEKDIRVDEKYFDIQIRSNRPTSVVFYKENDEELNLSFEDTRWKSLTNLICKAKNKTGEEEFQKYKDISSLTYIFKSEEAVDLTLRAVVGEAKENAFNTGYILTNSKEVSSEFVLKIKKSS